MCISKISSVRYKNLVPYLYRVINNNNKIKATLFFSSEENMSWGRNNKKNNRSVYNNSQYSIVDDENWINSVISNCLQENASHASIWSAFPLETFKASQKALS